VVYAYNFSFWKKPIVRSLFSSARVIFVDRVEVIPAGATVAVWGLRSLPAEVEARVSVLHLEDGFLRSVGLGADLIRPVSWVVDTRGMYFDATRPSDLEVLLSETMFSQELLLRAADLRERIVSSGLTKYNVGAAGWVRPAGTDRVILVPGQVESDASLTYGASEVKTNLGLLQAVRSANPNAYVIYKPHPDVVAGLRAKGAAEGEVGRWCDETLVDVSMGELLLQVDEVHVLTSLAGFEALLRGKKVTCYGQPFYAGWGLTNDILSHPRRSRRLTLEELVAGALIMYPRYFDRHGGGLVAPELALDQLLAWRAENGGTPPWWRNLFRVVLRRVVGVR